MVLALAVDREGFSLAWVGKLVYVCAAGKARDQWLEGWRGSPAGAYPFRRRDVGPLMFAVAGVRSENKGGDNAATVGSDQG